MVEEGASGSELLEVRPDSRQTYLDLRPEYLTSLLAPLDDMWATFAEQAEPYARVIGDQIAGCCSIDKAEELHNFYLCPDFVEHAERVFAQLGVERCIQSVVVSTVEPAGAEPRPRRPSRVGWADASAPNGGRPVWPSR